MSCYKYDQLEDGYIDDIINSFLFGYYIKQKDCYASVQ